MKKLLILLLCAAVICSALCACNTAQKEEKGGLSVVTTIFPVYDWVRNITDGTDADLTMLIDTGVDLHSFQPTVDDIVKISACDVFIYVGGESDEWVDDALKEKHNDDMVVIDLMDVLADTVKEEEIVEGMEAEEEEAEEEEGEEGPEYDEHVWLSLRNAASVCDEICARMSDADAANAAVYSQNTADYTAQLDELDDAYTQAVQQGNTDTLVFGDRFPFRYLADDYGLSYYAAFAGCSAETEASFETIVFLADKVDELQLKNIMKIESSDGSIAETIRENTKDKNQAIRTLDSLQSTTKDDVADGVTYLGVMQDNLEVLKAALANR